MNKDLAFLNADGQSADEIRRFDWDNSTLGASSQWPQALKTALQMMLASHFPKAIVWGPHYITTKLHRQVLQRYLGGNMA